MIDSCRRLGRGHLRPPQDLARPGARERPTDHFAPFVRDDIQRIEIACMTIKMTCMVNKEPFQPFGLGSLFHFPQECGVGGWADDG